MSAETSARPELRTSRTNPCSTARFAAPLACSDSACLREVDSARDVESGVVAHQPQRFDAQRLAVDGQLDGALIAQAIVDELQIELLDGRGHAQRVGVVEVADDANRAAGRRRSCRARNRA